MNALTDSFATGMVQEAGAYITDTDSLDVVRQALPAGADCIQADLAEAIRLLDGVPTPGILIVDIDQCPDVMAGLANLADVCDPGTSVVVLGSVNDLRLYQQLKDEGVDEYLLKPVTADAVNQALGRLASPAQEKSSAPAPVEEAGHCEVMAVIGSRGGTGATMLATSLSWLLAEKAQKKVALLDLDPLFGGVCLTLDLEPGPGLAEALSDPDRIDSLFLERAMMRHGDRLGILAGENALHDAPGLDYHAVSHLIDELRTGFDYVIIDFPRAALGQLPQAGALFDKVILVSDLSLHSLRDCMRIKGHFDTDMEQGAVQLVTNAPRGDGKPETALEEFEKASGMKALAMLPHDSKAAHEAAQEGKALSEVAKGGYAQAMTGLLQQLSGQETTKPSAFKKLMTLSFSF